MELNDLFNMLKKRWLLITLITLCCTILSALISFYYLKPMYKANISVLIDDANLQKTTDQNYNSVLMYQKLVATYSQFAKSKMVAKDIIQGASLTLSEDKVISMISTSSKNDTQFLTLSVTSTNNSEAAIIANQLARSLKKVTAEVKKIDNVLIVDDAVTPQSPYSPNKPKNIAIGFLVGLMLSVGLSLLLEILDSTVKNDDEISALLGVPVVGVIPLLKESKKGGINGEEEKALAFR